MTQVSDGASPFERPTLSPQELLAPWLAFVAQATTSAELQAVGHALDATCCELDLLHSFEHGVSFVRCGYAELMPNALSYLRTAQQSHTQALWHWQKAVNWLQEFGREAQQALYAPLLAHAQQQQERLVELAGQLGEQVTRLCQEWGVTLEGD